MVSYQKSDRRLQTAMLELIPKYIFRIYATAFLTPIWGNRIFIPQSWEVGELQYR